MLWIKKENIEKIWPLVCNDNPKGTDIRKFETLGTRSFPIEQGIGEAINFHTAIGSKRKEERIRYLKNYWATRVKEIPKVKINTSLKDEFSCAICGVSIDGMTPGELDNALFNNYKIHTVGIVWDTTQSGSTGYSTSTGEFTCPVSGTYQFSVNIQHNAAFGTESFYVDLLFNGATRRGVRAEDDNTGFSYSIASGSWTTYCTAGTTVSARLQAGHFWGDGSSFSGCLIG
jgi:hypothetical protein